MPEDPCPAGTWVHAFAMSFVCLGFTFLKAMVNAKAGPGGCVFAYAFAMSDPVGSLEHGFDREGGITLQAEGDGHASVTLEIVDSFEGVNTTLWSGWAVFTFSGNFEESGSWPKKWQISEHGAHYPKDTITEDVEPDHVIYTYCNVTTSVTSGGGGGWAKATVSLPVGGTAFPVDKLALLTPYIASAIAVGVVMIGAVSAKKRWIVPKL